MRIRTVSDSRRTDLKAVPEGEFADRAAHHASWPETFINSHDCSTMRLIPAGEFTMGSSQQDIESARRLDRDGEIFPLSHDSYALSHETPQFELFVPAYYLSVFTVTNEQFARFLTQLQPGPATWESWVYSTPHIIKPERQSLPYRVQPEFA